MDSEDSKEFIRVREEKLGGPLVYRVYATWFSELGRERREFGVFLYSDGKTLVIEDFFRPGKLLGYELGTKREEERRRAYVKLEIPLPLDEVEDVSYVSRSSAEASLRSQEDRSKPSSAFNKVFTKNCTRLKASGRTFFLELPSYREFSSFINKHRGGDK